VPPLEGTITFVLVITVERTETTRRTSADRGDQLLLWAASFFTLAVLLHNGDHLRRGADAVSRDVFWVGTAGVFVEVGIVVLACQRHRLAPLAAVAVGWSLAPAYVLVHFLPARSWLSDSFTSATHVSRLSWSAASLEVLAALVLGVAGWLVLQQRGGLASATRPHPSQRSLREGLTHPVALVMLAGNVVIVAGSFAQL
jgi:hypothetical protein